MLAISRTSVVPTHPPSHPPTHPPRRSSTSPVAPPLVPSRRHRVMISRSTASKACTIAAATRSSSCSAVAGGPSPAPGGGGHSVRTLYKGCLHPFASMPRPPRARAASLRLAPCAHTCARAHGVLSGEHVVQPVGHVVCRRGAVVPVKHRCVGSVHSVLMVTMQWAGKSTEVRTGRGMRPAGFRVDPSGSGGAALPLARQTATQGTQGWTGGDTSTPPRRAALATARTAPAPAAPWRCTAGSCSLSCACPPGRAASPWPAQGWERRGQVQ